MPYATRGVLSGGDRVKTPSMAYKKKKLKKVLAIPKRMGSNKRMKNKVTFAQVLLSVRKSGGRPSVAFTTKKVKAKTDRSSWKREQE
jgi:hypothetical protein